MRYIHLLFFCIIMLPLGEGCQDKTVAPPAGEQYPLIEKVMLKSKWNTNSQTKYRVEVKVFDPQGIDDLDTVLSISVVNRHSGNTVLEDTLFDDGAFYREDGDAFGKDGSFSNLYSVRDVDPNVNDAEGGEYTFRFQVRDRHGHESDFFDTDVMFLFDHLPEIRHIITAPDSLLNGDQQKNFHIAVADSDGLDDIIDAYFTGHPSETGSIIFKSQLYNDGTHGDQTAGDSIYSTVIDSSFAVAKMGLYYLKFYLSDKLAEINETVPVTTLYIENGLGEIETIFMADTLARPTTTGNRIAFQVEVVTYDPQGPGDIESIYFQSKKPDGSYGSGGAYFYLYDDGRSDHDDRIAGDGIFSTRLYLEAHNDPGMYHFLFYLRDKLGRSTQAVIDSIYVQ